MEILIIIGLVILNGFFSMYEMSLVSARKFKLENARKKGSSGAKTALELSENPSKFLSTVQIGITLIGILLGVYSGENLTSDVSAFLVQFDVLRPYAGTMATGIVVIFVTYLSIVLGELLPKRIGMSFPESIAIFLAKPMNVLSKLTSPFVWLLSQTNNLLMRILGIHKTSESKVSEEEIKSLIKEGAEGGDIQDIEQHIVERVFELGDRKVNSLLTHRTDIVYFKLDDNWEKVTRKINEEKHSAYPVCRTNDLDDIAGIVQVKDLFSNDNAGFHLEHFIRKPIFLNENTFAYEVLDIFKKERMHYAIVIDEYGSTVGMVTMDDVLDALVGEVTEGNQDEYQIVARDANSWLVDGQYPIFEFAKYFSLDISELGDGFNTVAGLIIHISNTLPEIGARIHFEDLELEIIDKDGQRIDKILVTRKTIADGQ